MSIKVRDFVKQLADLGCRITNTKGADQTWRTPKGNAFFLKINKMGDDITVGTLGSVMRVLKRDGFRLEGTTLIASPDAYPEGFSLEGQKPETRDYSSSKKIKVSNTAFVCPLCQKTFEDRPHSNKVKKHLELCGKPVPLCRFCRKEISSSLGLQRHETHCPKKASET